MVLRCGLGLHLPSAPRRGAFLKVLEGSCSDQTGRFPLVLLGTRLRGRLKSGQVLMRAFAGVLAAHRVPWF